MMGSEVGTMEVSCLSHHIILRAHALSMTTGDINLDYLVKVVFMSFLHCKVPFSFFL